jgi:hypothetical protein
VALKVGRAFIDRGLAADGSRTLVPLDGGTAIYVPGPTPPPSSSMLVGASVNPANATQLAKLEGQLGQTLGVMRLYDSDFPATWAQSTGSLGGNRPVVISHKPDVIAMASGSLDAQYQTILDGAPKNRRIYWVLGQHEGDVKVNTGSYTVAQWRAAAIRMGNMVRAMNVAAWRTCVVVTMQPFNGGKSYSASDFWTGIPADIMTVDKFNPNKDPANNPYRPLSYFISDAVTWFKANSVPWGITETNTYEDVNDLTKKATWMQQAGLYLSQNGCQLVTYWDSSFSSDPDQNARRLASSQPALTAWAQVMATYNP